MLIFFAVEKFPEQSWNRWLDDKKHKPDINVSFEP